MARSRATRSAMGGCVEKSVVQPAAGERVDDEQVRGRRGRVRIGATFEATSSFSSALASPYGLAGHLGAGGVGLELAGARDRELDQGRRQRRQHDHEQAADEAAAADPSSSLSRRPPPKIIAHCAMCAM